MKTLVLLFVVLLTGGPQSPRQADSVRRVQLAEIYYSGDKEGYLAANRELIEYHARQGNERYMFNAYATMLDRLQMWGRMDEAMAVLEEMSGEAARRRSEIGEAVTAFCFGQFYLGNRQPRGAEGHYRKAFRQLIALGEDSRALRAGLNLQAVAMNLNDPEGGILINDSTSVLLQRIEEKAGRPDYANRIKQARYRFVLLQRVGDLTGAEAMQDTMLRYAAICNDPGLEESIQTAIIQFDQLTGNKASAYERLDSLIERNRRDGNWVKAAQFRLALADYQRDNGDYARAVDSYRSYVAESDSAQLYRTNEQLNALTKQYELNELRLENRMARQRLSVLGVTAVLLLLLLIGWMFYARTLKKKNRALYQASLEFIHNEEQAEDALIRQEDVSGRSPEEQLYASLLSLLHDEQLFKDPELGRDQLSLRLGTNRTYLSEAIRACSGLTVSGLINHHRIRWAAETLIADRKTPVGTVGEDAGFISRATFNRMFQDQYGMSPSAYRVAASYLHD